MPAFGLLGIDWGYGFDKLPGQPNRSEELLLKKHIQNHPHSLFCTSYNCPRVPRSVFSSSCGSHSNNWYYLEHVMLVDLARNDLSKISKNVEVERFKDIQFYSHVIHLVSKVTGDITSDKKIDLISGTFPAGTLSGAPKHKAMQLIEEHENVSREFYGGAIGFMGFNGDFNHAIIIRSFLSKNRRLFYQAGAGIVFKSNPDSENQEVYNKIEALRKAIKTAEKI